MFDPFVGDYDFRQVDFGPRSYDDNHQQTGLSPRLPCLGVAVARRTRLKRTDYTTKCVNKIAISSPKKLQHSPLFFSMKGVGVVVTVCLFWFLHWFGSTDVPVRHHGYLVAAQSAELPNTKRFFQLPKWIASPSAWYGRRSSELHKTAVGRICQKDKATTLYDAIVIGGGAAGCPFARTLADAGLDVLLIERGETRKQHPDTLDISGTGLVIEDPGVAQLLVTDQGIRSHIPHVLSGGTAINVGIVIYELDDYFKLLENVPGVQFNRALLEQATNWTASLIAHAAAAPKPLGYEYMWRRVLERTVGPFVGKSMFLETNRTWHSYSLFNGENQGYRSASDVSLGQPYRDFPPTLRVLLQHVVRKIEFSEPTASGKRRATCVAVHKTEPKDLAPILSGQRPLNSTLLGTILRQLGIGDPMRIFDVPEYSTPKSEDTYCACVKANGIIVSSAGALLTPLLLFHSGVGPVEDVSRLNVPLVREVHELGRNLRDRAMIPLVTFSKRRLPETPGAKVLKPRICHSIAYGYVGQKCPVPDTNSVDCLADTTSRHNPLGTPQGLNASQMLCDAGRVVHDNGTRRENDPVFFSAEDQPPCSPIGFQVLSGSRMSESIFTATRYMLPPALRSSLTSEFLMTMLRTCQTRTSLNKTPPNGIICTILAPIIKCLRRVVAGYFFPAEVKSAGRISIGVDRKPHVSANYMHHPDDILAMTRGVATMGKIVDELYREGSMETASPFSCPTQILNAFLSSIETQLLAYRWMEASDKASNAEAFVEADTLRQWLIEEVKGLEMSTANASFKHPPRSEKDQASFASITLPNLSSYVNKSMSTAEFFTTLRAIDLTETNGTNRGRPATFPVLPIDPNDEVKLANWVRMYMTSLWHWVGSAALGVVVNNEFVVEGFENLMIVDASVLTNMTRMNPTATIMSLGRYAGLLTRDRLAKTSSKNSSRP